MKGIVGKEKAIAAGTPGIASAAVTLVWFLMSLFGWVEAPSEGDLRVAVTFIVGAVFSAFAAYTATNTGTYTIDALSDLAKGLRDELAEKTPRPMARPD